MIHEIRGNAVDTPEPRMTNSVGCDEAEVVEVVVVVGREREGGEGEGCVPLVAQGQVDMVVVVDEGRGDGEAGGTNEDAEAERGGAIYLIYLHRFYTKVERFADGRASVCLSVCTRLVGDNLCPLCPTVRTRCNGVLRGRKGSPSFPHYM